METRSRTARQESAHAAAPAGPGVREEAGPEARAAAAGTSIRTAASDLLEILATDWGALLALTALACWFLGHFPMLGPIFIPAWVLTGLATGIIRPWYGLLVTVAVVPFYGGWTDQQTGEMLRVVPVYGAAVRVLADRFIVAPSFGRETSHEPPWWVVAAAIAAVGLYALTALTGYLAEGKDELWLWAGLRQLVGGSMAMMVAWIVAAHVVAGKDRTLTVVALITTAVASVVALGAWFSIPVVDLFTFVSRVEGGRLGALGYPTPTAMGLATTLPLAFVAAYRFRRWLVIPLVGLVLVVMVLTYSRGPLIALGIGAVAGALATGRVDRRVALAGAAVAALAFAGLVAFRFGTTPEAIAAAFSAMIDSDGNRVRSWLATVPIVMSNPAFGGGWYALNRFEDFYQYGVANAHNTILDGFASGGVPLGVTNAIVILYSAWMTLVRRHTMVPYLIASVVTFLVCTAWDIPNVRSYAAVMGGIVLGMAAGPLIARDESTGSDADPGRQVLDAPA
jgi:hypothetical protein